MTILSLSAFSAVGEMCDLRLFLPFVENTAGGKEGRWRRLVLVADSSLKQIRV